MDSEVRGNVAISIVIAGALLGSVFMMSSCVQNQNAKTKSVAEQCIAAGHRFVDTDKQYGMCM